MIKEGSLFCKQVVSIITAFAAIKRLYHYTDLQEGYCYIMRNYLVLSLCLSVYVFPLLLDL